MKPRIVAAAVSLAVAVVALVLLLIPVSATSPGGRDLSCGSGFYSSDLTANAPGSQTELAAEIERARLDTRYTSLLQGYQAACGDALGARRGWGFGLLGLGVLAGVGALVVRRPRASSVPPAAA